MICKNCNAEISDDLRFCPFCGAENAEEVPETDLLVTENYDEGSEETSLLVQNEVSSVSEQPVPVMQQNNNVVVNEPVIAPQDAGSYVPKVNITDMVQKVEEPSKKAKKEKSPKKKKVIAIIAIVLCVAIVGGGVGAFFLSNSGKEDIEPVTYITEDGELYVVDSLGKKEAVTYLITDEYAYEGFEFSSDGKYVVYTTGDSDDEDFNIEYKKVADDKAEPVVLVKGAETLYGANDNLSEIIYSKNDNVCITNEKGESETLIKNAYIYDATENLDALLCVEEDEDERIFHYVDISSREATEIYNVKEDTFEGLSVADDLSFMIVQEDGTLTKVYNDGEKEKVAKDVVSSDLIGGKIYYTTEGNSVTYLDLVNDTLKAADAKAVEPEWEDYCPDYDDYKVTKQDYWFGTYETIDYDAYYKAYDIAEEKYYAAYDEYEAADDRNYYREMLAENEIKLYDLYSYDSEATLILSNLYDAYISGIYNMDGTGESDKIKVVALATDISSIEKTDITAITDFYDFMDEIDSYVDTCDYIVDGTSNIKLDVSDKLVLHNVWYDSDSSEYVLGVYEVKDDTTIDEICTLYSLSPSATSFKEAEVIVEEVYAVAYFDGEYITYTDYKEKSSSMTMNVNGEEIDDVHNMALIYSESSPKDFYYATDYSQKTGESTVWKYSNGKSTQVAEDVYFSSYTFCEFDGKYLALTDYEDASGDLICISGDETYEIESKVRIISGNMTSKGSKLSYDSYFDMYGYDYDEDYDDYDDYYDYYDYY